MEILSETFRDEYDRYGLKESAAEKLKNWSHEMNRKDIISVSQETLFDDYADFKQKVKVITVFYWVS